MHWRVALVGLALLVEACGFVDVAPVDRGRLVVDGVELRPESLPWAVGISPNVENPEAVAEALRSINEQLAPVVAFERFYDEHQFHSVAYWPAEVRSGFVLVFQGYAQVPVVAGGAGRSFIDPGAVTDLVWNEDGEIYSVEITISSDIAYDPQTVRDAMAHEAGHALGLAHDDRSQDLRSCMSSPPAYDCRLTPADVRLVKGE